ncbi:ABC transporter ATP-binding protein [Paradesertivirga mongoliensis]|uniref:ABC transporter ATP-binding protein n=1 Tax=Paradesertivirga mongoliensis TaxID=2100740 RepID=A0ABW4ZGM6_9SPHI|nr:ABC transporter ATP-binding protein [Pedobacter mongoliensis]
MSEIAIKAENVSKAYQLGEIGTGTISRDLERWWAKIRGKEDPYLRIGETNDRAQKGSSDIVWSLKDITFEINQGDAVGIIGRNGAGKSTLLKILSKVTSPTTGTISGKGRIASLLEVGTGFHPELTGRENIFLNGAILGMRKREITRKFDEIVDFAGVERYIDTPVKRYSSGMYVRLAFAVAAHLESEILIVDEVLAVGDAEFQRKCLGKMEDVSKGEGRTVLFVSHNMASIKALCNRGILLSQGTITSYGDIDTVVNEYSELPFSINPRKRTGTDNVRTSCIKFYNSAKSTISGNDLLFNNHHIIDLYLEVKEQCKDVSIALCFNNLSNQRVTSLWSKFNGELFTLTPGLQKLEFDIPKIRLIPGCYEVIIYIESKGQVLELIYNYTEVTISMPSDTASLESPQQITGYFVEDFKNKLVYDN